MSAKSSPVDAALLPLDTYIAQLADGSLFVSKWTRLAAKRHLSDLKKSQDPSWPYEFDRKTAAKVIGFCGLLTHVKGDLAGEKLELHPWAMFFLASIFAWRRKDTKTRRYRKAFCFLPRGNSKSTTLSAASLYATFVEGKQNDTYCFATKREQAQIVWGDAAAMLRGSPKVRARLGVNVGAHALTQPETNSTFKPMASEAKSLDGLNVSFAIIDELHEVTRELGEIVTTALGKRASSILVSISTAGFDTSSYAHETWTYCEDILEGRVTDDLVFGLIYAAPEGANWLDEETWKAANPMYGTAVRPEIIAQSAAQAQRLPGSKAAFLVKHLNIWQDSASPWMDMVRWDACADTTLTRDQFEGQPCIIGLDLATRRDLTAKLLVFPQVEEDGSRSFTIFCDTYLHESGVAESANDSFVAWASNGLITTNPGDVTDLTVVKGDLLLDRDLYDVREVCYDPYYAATLTADLESEGMVPVEIRQTVPLLSPAMRAVEGAVYSDKLRHDGNPVLRYCISNVIARRDANDNVFPRKENENRHIDAASALFDAFARAAVAEVSAGRPRIWSLDDDNDQENALSLEGVGT